MYSSNVKKTCYIEFILSTLDNSGVLISDKPLIIGKAGTSLKTRVNQFYNHILGNSNPHRGGHWLKTLDNLAHLNIYLLAAHDEPAHEVY